MRDAPWLLPAGPDTHDKAATQRILRLLEGVEQPNGNPNTAKATTLEYRGQWQPAPNGAETGHGVVPKDWAIELASENDRQLASFGWAGGAQLCLSNAFREAEVMEAQARDLIDTGVCTEDDAAVQCIRTIAKATEEREALMRRQWCDIDFQEGEAANQELLKHLERDFAGQLSRVAKGVAEDGSWYHIKVAGGTKPGKVYLSARIGGEGVDLWGHDDESGRQRWLVEPEGHCFRLRLLGGTTRGRRLLSRAVGGRLELEERDDRSGRQLWALESSSEDWVHIRPAQGEPGLGPAAAVEAGARGRFLSAGADGALSLNEVDDGSGRQRWVLPGWSGKLPSGADDVVAIAVHSGAQGAVSLKDLTREQMTRTLSNNRNLGTAIDLVGAYLKNYEIDKADRLCARIEPLCRERGGVWLFKLLNFYTTVRMKQSRYEEALQMYKEYETYIGFSPTEAWELYDTVYRNYGWIYTSLNEYEKALEYFEKAVEVKRGGGVKAHWFDQWDLGKTHARLSLQRGRPQNLELALKLIEEGLEMHRAAEPKDVIMRCKMLNSAGECASVRGDFCDDKRVAEGWYDRAIKLHKQSYDLYMQVLGPSKPLTGWAMEDLAGAYSKRGLHAEAAPLLRAALTVECTKDIIKLSSMARLLGSVLDAHRHSGEMQGLALCQDAINRGLENLQRRRINRAEGPSYAALLQKIAEVLMAHDSANCAGAAALLREGLAYLQQPESTPQARTDPCEGRFYIPRAGQQEMEVDVGELRSSMEQQLALLPSDDDPQPEAMPGSGNEPNSPGRASSEGVAASPPDASEPLAPGGGGGEATADAAPMGSSEATRAETRGGLPPQPEHFEIIDEFAIVD